MRAARTYKESLTCVICGLSEPRTSHLRRPLCHGVECARAYALIVATSDTYVDNQHRDGVLPDEDGCLIWQGKLEQGKRPVIHQRTHDSGNSTSQIRLRSIVVKARGEDIPYGRKVDTACGKVRCLLPEHLVIQWSSSSSTPMSDHDRVFLDPAPLVAAWERFMSRTIVHRSPTNENSFMARYNADVVDRAGDRLMKAIRNGRVTLRLVDEICCDVLGIHPYALYGDEYFKDLKEDAA